MKKKTIVYLVLAWAVLAISLWMMGFFGVYPEQPDMAGIILAVVSSAIIVFAGFLLVLLDLTKEEEKSWDDLQKQRSYEHELEVKFWVWLTISLLVLANIGPSLYDIGESFYPTISFFSENKLASRWQIPTAILALIMVVRVISWNDKMIQKARLEVDGPH